MVSLTIPFYNLQVFLGWGLHLISVSLFVSPVLSSLHPETDREDFLPSLSSLISWAIFYLHRHSLQILLLEAVLGFEKKSSS